MSKITESIEKLEDTVSVLTGKVLELESAVAELSQKPAPKKPRVVVTQKPGMFINGKRMTFAEIREDADLMKELEHKGVRIPR